MPAQIINRCRRAGGALLPALALLALLACLILGAPRPAHPAHPGGVSPAPEELVAAIPRDFPPMYSLDKVGRPQGFAVDVLNALAPRAGFRVRYQVYNSWPEAMEAVREGRADLIPNLGITSDRDASLEFTRPVNTFDVVLFVRSTTQDVNSLDDLRGRRVGTSAQSVAQDLLSQHQGLQVVILLSPSEGLYQLLSGDIDAFAYPEPVGWELARRAGLEERIKVVGTPLAEVKRGMAIKHGRPELLLRLDQALAGLLASPEYQAIYRRWFGRPDQAWSAQEIVVISAILLAACLLVMGLWRYFEVSRLNRQLRASIAQGQQTEEALRQSEAKFRLAFLTSPDAIAISRASDGSFLDVNEGFSQLHGLSREQAIGHTSTELGLWCNPRERLRLLGALEQKGVARNLEVTLRRADGQGVAALMSAVVLQLAGESCILSFTKVIEDLKKAQETISQSEEKFRLAFHTSPDAIAIAEMESGHYVEVNDVFCQISGYPREEVLGRSSRELGLWVDLADRQRLHEALARTGLARNLEARVRLKDGRPVAALISAGLLQLEGQRYILYIIKIIEDLKQAQEALQLSEEKFAKAFMGSPLWVSITTLAEGRFLEVNEAFSTISGYTRDEVIGRTSTELGFWSDPQQARGAIKDIIAREGHLREHETQLIFKDGQPHDVVWSAEPIEFSGQRCLVNVIVDVTEKRRLLQQKAALESQLAQAQKMEAVGTLAGGIAHDFNNILAAVLGFAEIAQEVAKEGGDNRSELAQIVESAQRAGHLVRQILTFSRKVKADRRPLSLNDTLASTLIILERTLPKMIAIQTSLAPDLDLVDADPTQMEQVIFNLVANAKDAMPEGGLIRLSTANLTVGPNQGRQWPEVPPGPYVLLVATDNGQGMAPETLAQIFDPFFTTKGPGKGTGLGLSTVYGIVQGHGGHIFCQSQPGQGTSFQVLLPAYLPSAQPRAARLAVEDQALGGRESLLLVDDEPPLLEVGRRILGAAGYQVLTASSGEQALEIIQDQGRAVDLVILDLSMPGMGGHRCLERIMALAPQTRVLVASGYSAEGMAAQALAAGALAFVAKPFGKAELLGAVRQALDQNRGPALKA